MRTDTQYHNSLIMQMGLELESLEIEMVSQVPLDPMQLLDLGTTRKILNLLFKNKTTQLITASIKDRISSVLNFFAPHIVMEFGRKSQTMSKWKSVKFRQISLYTGFVIF